MSAYPLLQFHFIVRPRIFSPSSSTMIIYKSFNVDTRWLKFSLPTYFTPKLFTTRANVMFLVLCFQRAGVQLQGTYPYVPSCSSSLSLAIFPDCLRPGIPWCISMYTYPLLCTMWSSQQCAMTSGGISECFIFIYSKFFIGVP